jgi:hypothetical protein
MSFDLAVWYEPAPITVDVADAWLAALYESEVPDGITPRPEVAAFVADLLGGHPADGEVWESAPVVGADFVLMSFTEPAGDRMREVVRGLAERHGLVCYDPQTEQIAQPPPDLTGDTLVLTVPDGSMFLDPDPERIAHTVRGLDEYRYFAILERAGSHYVQVAYDPDGHHLERRDGGPDRHFHTTVPGLAEAATAFAAFAAREQGWERRYEWTRLEF